MLLDIYQQAREENVGFRDVGFKFYIPISVPTLIEYPAEPVQGAFFILGGQLTYWSGVEWIQFPGGEA